MTYVTPAVATNATWYAYTVDTWHTAAFMLVRHASSGPPHAARTETVMLPEPGVNPTGVHVFTSATPDAVATYANQTSFSDGYAPSHEAVPSVRRSRS